MNDNMEQPVPLKEGFLLYFLRGEGVPYHAGPQREASDFSQEIEKSRGKTYARNNIGVSTGKNRQDWGNSLRLASLNHFRNSGAEWLTLVVWYVALG